MPSASTRKPSTPARQPKSTASIWPSGADSSAPSEPDAVMAPSTRLRERLDTAREPTASAIAEAVQASATPIMTPAPSITPSMPSAMANMSMPAM